MKQKLEINKTLLKCEDVFSKKETDIGCFQSTDGGSSKVHFDVIDPDKTCYSVSRRVPYARKTGWKISKREY